MNRMTSRKRSISSGLRGVLALFILFAMLTPVLFVPVSADGGRTAVPSATESSEEDYSSYTDEELIALAQEAEKNCRDYSTTSTGKVALELPFPEEHLDESLDMQIKFTKNGALLILPKPQTGNGNLGAITAGTRVTVIAQYKTFYFFVAEDGRMGWTGKANLEDAPARKEEPKRTAVTATTSKVEYDLYSRDELAALAQEAETNCRDYSTTSTNKVELELPYTDDYLTESLDMQIKFTKNGALLILPKPQTGNGNLGAITAGTRVTVIAQCKTFYFFVAEDGRMGWTGKANLES